jgi:hypothetical protein
MAFGIFNKRRRGEQAAAPAEELSVVAVAVVDEVAPPESDPEADEALLPRWRRPSLLLARRGDTFHDDKPAPPLTFELGQVGPSDGHERRLIRYRLVRMLDTPDELRGTEIGYLDRGDEVQLIEKYGAYWLVLCPDGRQGWVHNMTLGEVIDGLLGADQPSAPVAPVAATATTWMLGEADADNDVLDAYLESRRRSL